MPKAVGFEYTTATGIADEPLLAVDALFVLLHKPEAGCASQNYKDYELGMYSSILDRNHTIQKSTSSRIRITKHSSDGGFIYQVHLTGSEPVSPMPRCHAQPQANTRPVEHII